jgi:hypothetical protein
MSKVLYFSGTTPVKNVFGLDNAKFAAIGGTKSKHNWYDSFARLAGHPVEGSDAVLPVTRTIFYKSNPSLHKCDARCRHAKGNSCECSCGGEFHGAGD